MKKTTFWMLLLLLTAFSSYAQECTSSTAFSESFDAVTTPNLPRCWSKILRGTNLNSNAYVKTVRSTFKTAPNAVEFSNLSSKVNSNNAAANDIILVTPALSNLTTGTHRLRFTAKNAGLLQVVTLNSNTQNAVFTLFKDVEIAAGTKEYTVNFTNYSGTNNYIGIRFNSIADNSTIILDEISWEPIPSCPDITGVSIAGIRDTQATATWEQVSQESGWEYAYGTSTVTNPNTLTANPVTASTVTITGLSASTNYKFWVRSVCGESKGVWSGPYTFTTACAPVTTFNQTFDSGLTRPNLPSCWSKIIRGTGEIEAGTIKTVDWVNNSEPNSVEFYSGLATPSTTNEFILVSPYVSTLNAGGYRLKFFGQSDYNIEFEVGTTTGNGADAVFTTVQTVQIARGTAFKQYVVNFANTTTDNYVAIRMLSGEANVYGFLDNLVWEQMPACPDVTDVALSAASTTDASIYWTVGGSESGWEVAYGATSVSDPNTLTNVIPTTLTNVTIGGLTANTSYNVWVRATCGATKGAWIGPLVIKTECNPVTTLNEGFENAGEGLPDCWSSIIRGETVDTSVASVAITNDTPITGSASVQIRTGNSNVLDDRMGTADDIILVSPNLSTVGSGLYRLRFKAQYGEVLQVGSLNGNTASAQFTPIQEISTTGVADEYVVNFTSVSTDTYIGFRANSETPSQDFYIDDVVWELIPPCPDVKAINVPTVTPATAIVNWTAGESEAAWDIAYAPTTVTDPATATIVTATAATATLTGLTEGISYNVWVRSSCDEGKGNWIGPVTFRTPCLPVTALNENFDATSDIPNCWSTIVSGNTLGSGAYVNTQNDVDNAYSGTNSVEFRPYFSLIQFDDKLMLVSPNLSNIGAGTNRLKFFAKGTDAIIEIGTLNYASEFTVLKTIKTKGAYAEYVINFDEFTGNTGNFIGFRLRSTKVATVLNIDNVVWEAMPSCPDVTNIVFPTISTTSATVSWTRGKNETGWQVAYGPESVTDPNTLTPSQVSTTSTSISGLTAETTYNVWVRANCGTENGAWIGPVKFRTSCLPITSFSENFDSVEVPNLPGCWSTIVDGITVSSTASVETSVDYSTEPAGNAVQFLNQESNTLTNDRLILVSPNLSNLGAGTHRLKFRAKTDAYGGSGQLNIVTLNGNTTFAAATFFKRVTLTNDFAEYVVYFTNYKGADTYIGLQLYTEQSYNTTLVDNVVWEEVPANECLAVKNITFDNITTTSANVSWVATGGETSWSVAYGATTVTDPSTLTAQTVTVENAVLTGLQETTTYNVWVRSNCGNGNTTWSGPVQVSTRCAAVNVPYLLDFESVTVPELPACTEISKTGNGNDWETADNQQAGFTSKGLRYSGNSFQVANAWFYTRGINLVAGKNYQISYKYGNKIGDVEFGETFRVAYGTDTREESMVLPLNEHFNVTDEALETATFDFKAQATGIYYFGFNVTSNGSGLLFIDDIQITEVPPTCPDVTGIAVTEISNTNAKVSWNAASGSEWEVVYGEATITDPGSLVPITTVTSPTITLTGLEIKTAYNVWVRSVCDAGKGDWILATFTTTTLSSDEFTMSGLKYYPNPVDNVFNLSYTKDISKVEVYNLLGQQILSSTVNANTASINMSALSAGTYLVKVTSGDAVKAIKVIKR
jgi:hypothetical protein